MRDILIVGAVLLLGACSDSETTAGVAGAAGSAGAAGNAGTAGSAGATGNAGNGGSAGAAGNTGAAGSAGAVAPGELPEHWKAGLEPGVNWGLAEAYPEDVGITSHPHVLAAEDFETGTVTIPTQEDRYKNNVAVTDTQHYTGKYAGVHSWPEGLNGPTCRYTLGKEALQEQHPAWFMRMCFKYDSSFHPVDLSRGVGVKGFGIYFEDGSDNGSGCAGMSWYDASCQFVGWGPSGKPQANNGYLWVGHLYSYNPYPEQAVATLGSINVTPAPDGGEPCRFSSYAEPFEYLAFDSWRCYELGLYLNTPGQNDGEARFWIDGVLQSRTTNMRFRDKQEQIPTSLQLNLHRVTEDFPQTMVRWADNIVLARQYIGPVKL